MWEFDCVVRHCITAPNLECFQIFFVLATKHTNSFGEPSEKETQDTGRVATALDFNSFELLGILMFGLR